MIHQFLNSIGLYSTKCIWEINWEMEYFIQFEVGFSCGRSSHLKVNNNSKKNPMLFHVNKYRHIIFTCKISHSWGRSLQFATYL